MKNLQRRSQIRRIRTILMRLREEKYPNCTTLAKDLGTNRRTVLRDLDFIRDELGAEIEYDRSRYGFRLVGKVGDMLWLTINQGELIALILAEKAMDEFSGTPFEQPLHSAMQKLAESLDGAVTFEPDELDSIVSFHDVGMGLGYLPVFQTISDALNKRLEIKFSYLKLNAVRREQRHVQPYHLACIKRQWYLFAYDRRRQEIRRFVLSRMKDVVVTGTRFAIPKDFSVKNLLKGSFGVHSATGEYDVRIRFTGLSATLVQERKWQGTQAVIPLPGGKIELRMQLTSLEEVEGWILGWGVDALVLGPPELRDRIANRARQMAALYAQ